MQGTPTTELSQPKKRRVRRPKFRCTKCEVKVGPNDVPPGWLIVWDAECGRFKHYCLGCQDGKRSRKRS